MRRLFAFVCLGITYLCLYPWHFRPYPAYALAWESPRRLVDWVDSISNVILFMPLGITAMLAWPHRPILTAAIVFPLATGFSYGIEWLQRLLPGRFATLRDVASNSLGAALGLAVGYAMTKWSVWVNVSHRKSLRGAPFAILLTAAWFIAHGFPFLPVLRQGQWTRAQENILHPDVQWMPAIDIFLGMVVLYAVYRWVLESKPQHSAKAALVAGLSACVFLGQALVLDFTFQPYRFVAALAGLAAACVSFRELSLLRFRMLAATLLIWLVIRELWPFQFSAVALPIAWIPFEPIFNSTQHVYARSVWWKWFLYASILWTLLRSNVRLLTGSAVLLALLACCEFGQRWIPGRTPEMTDLALAIIGAAVLSQEDA